MLVGGGDDGDDGGASLPSWRLSGWNLCRNWCMIEEAEMLSCVMWFDRKTLVLVEVELLMMGWCWCG